MTSGSPVSQAISATPRPNDPRVGKTIGQCLIQQKLGQGGMGTVYLGRHLTLNKPVAVKVLRGDLPTDLHGVERFLREARAAARLEHHRIVQIYDAGQQDDVYYIVMQYVPGESLATRLRREVRLPVPEALRIFRAVADGIAHAHASGIVHRDIKPDNILLGDDGSVKIVDFGLACMIEGDPSLSKSGTIVGSPNFMSPEQALGKRVDQRTDIYSLGATLYQMITGALPFQASSSIGVVCKVVKEPLRPPHEAFAGCSMELSRFISYLMRKDREKRVGSIRDVLGILDKIERQGAQAAARAPGNRVNMAIATALVTLLLLAIGYFAGPWGPSASAVHDTRQPPTQPPPAQKTPEPPPAGPPSAQEGRALESLPKAREDALRKRCQAFLDALRGERLAEARSFFDADAVARAPLGPKHRPILALSRLRSELASEKTAVKTVGWEDAARGIAHVVVETSTADRPVKLLWTLKGESWYLIPPTAAGLGTASKPGMDDE